MNAMPTHRAKVTFRAKEGEPEPCISIEQAEGGANIWERSVLLCFYDLLTDPNLSSLQEVRG